MCLSLKCHVKYFSHSELLVLLLIVLGMIVSEKILQGFVTYSNINLLAHKGACEMSTCLGQVRNGGGVGVVREKGFVLQLVVLSHKTEFSV
jgi:hypothetical protein